MRANHSVLVLLFIVAFAGCGRGPRKTILLDNRRDHELTAVIRICSLSDVTENVTIPAHREATVEFNTPGNVLFKIEVSHGETVIWQGGGDIDDGSQFEVHFTDGDVITDIDDL